MRNASSKYGYAVEFVRLLKLLLKFPASCDVAAKNDDVLIVTGDIHLKPTAEGLPLNLIATRLAGLEYTICFLCKPSAPFFGKKVPKRAARHLRGRQVCEGRCRRIYENIAPVGVDYKDGIADARQKASKAL